MRPYLLIAALGGALALWWFLRTDKGRTLASDTLDEVIVTAKRVGDVFTPKGIRNNNPGNIEWIADPAKRWRGMVGSDGRYGIFDTPANGIRAIGGELKASIRKGQTIEQAITEWAPPPENNTRAYVAAVADTIGVDKDSRLTTAMLPRGALAIIQHENGQQPYDPADVAAWVNS